MAPTPEAALLVASVPSALVALTSPRVEQADGAHREWRWSGFSSLRVVAVRMEGGRREDVSGTR